MFYHPAAASLTVARTLTAKGFVYVDRRAEIWRTASPLIRRDLNELAPKFRVQIQTALDECNALGLEVAINEARRIDALQRLYWTAGRNPETGEVINRKHVLTGARSAVFGWHFFGLAVDVMHARLAYKYSETWVTKVSTVFERVGLAWGGRWENPDIPHYYWRRCKAAPSDKARELYFGRPTPSWHGMHPFDIDSPPDRYGLASVWHAVGAIDTLTVRPLFPDTRNPR